jgi:hypothetical protein
MRIWDLDPGYLNRQSLLGEHRELHGIVSIIANNKQGYSRHPETLRWVGHGWALSQRHRILAAEMALRGYKDHTPVRLRSKAGIWPAVYIDEPGAQYSILGHKYERLEQGRIPLPGSAQQLWAQHKYSVLARDLGLYKRIGKRVAAANGNTGMQALAKELVEILRMAPSEGGIKNALHHMWGYVSDLYGQDKSGLEGWPLDKLLNEIRKVAMLEKNDYLVSSTALGELGAWIKCR